MGTIKDKVAIIGMGCTKFGERWDKSADDLIIEAAYEAFEDAKIDPKAIQAAWVGTWDSGSTGLALAGPLKLDHVPVSRVENICATGQDVVRNAAFGVAAGVYDVVLAMGFEKMKDSWNGKGWGPPPPVGAGTLPNPPITAAAGMFAMAAVKYWETYGLSFERGKEVLAKIAAKNHHNGSLNPKAHFQNEITVEQAINAPMVSWPLGLFDCCPNADGAACAILCRADLAKNFRDDYVLLKGQGLVSAPGRGNLWSDHPYIHFTETTRASQLAFEQAGVKDPLNEIDMAEVHDCFTITELLIYEDLGLVKKGHGPNAVDEGWFQLDGKLAVNPDGGLKTWGHPTGASGIRMMYEVYKQLQGKAGPRQRKNPRLGMTHSLGGNPGAGFSCAVSVLGCRD